MCILTPGIKTQSIGYRKGHLLQWCMSHSTTSSVTTWVNKWPVFEQRNNRLMLSGFAFSVWLEHMLCALALRSRCGTRRELKRQSAVYHLGKHLWLNKRYFCHCLLRSEFQVQTLKSTAAIPFSEVLSPQKSKPHQVTVSPSWRNWFFPSLTNCLAPNWYGK